MERILRTLATVACLVVLPSLAWGAPVADNAHPAVGWHEELDVGLTAFVENLTGPSILANRVDQDGDKIGSSIQLGSGTYPAIAPGYATPQGYPGFLVAYRTTNHPTASIVAIWIDHKGHPYGACGADHPDTGCSATGDPLVLYTDRTVQIQDVDAAYDSELDEFLVTWEESSEDCEAECPHGQECEGEEGCPTVSRVKGTVLHNPTGWDTPRVRIMGLLLSPPGSTGVSYRSPRVEGTQKGNFLVTYGDTYPSGTRSLWLTSFDGLTMLRTPIAANILGVPFLRPNVHRIGPERFLVSYLQAHNATEGDTYRFDCFDGNRQSGNQAVLTPQLGFFDRVATVPLNTLAQDQALEVVLKENTDTAHAFWTSVELNPTKRRVRRQEIDIHQCAPQFPAPTHLKHQALCSGPHPDCESSSFGYRVRGAPWECHENRDIAAAGPMDGELPMLLVREGGDCLNVPLDCSSNLDCQTPCSTSSQCFAGGSCVAGRCDDAACDTSAGICDPTFMSTSDFATLDVVDPVGGRERLPRANLHWQWWIP